MHPESIHEEITGLPENQGTRMPMIQGALMERYGNPIEWVGKYSGKFTELMRTNERMKKLYTALGDYQYVHHQKPPEDIASILGQIQAILDEGEEGQEFAKAA